MAELTGFVRCDGSVGLRNHVLIIPTVICANVVCERIGDAVSGCVTIPHQHGCSQIGADVEGTYRILFGLGANPNVGAVLVLSLGCESIDGNQLVNEIAALGKPVELVRIQDEGGSQKAIHKGIEVATRLQKQVSGDVRVPIGWEDVRIGVKWGDGLHMFPHADVVASALTQLEALGCTILAGEPEKIMQGLSGARGRNLFPNGIGTKRESTLTQPLIDIHETNLPASTDLGMEPGDYPDFFGQAPANVIEYGERACGGGVHVVDTPCSDVLSLSTLAAAGANLCFFFSGGPSLVGNPVMPVLKVGNDDVEDIWLDHLDLVIDGAEVAFEPRLFSRTEQIVSGSLTASELLGHQEFSVQRVGLSL